MYELSENMAKVMVSAHVLLLSPFPLNVIIIFLHCVNSTTAGCKTAAQLEYAET